MQKTIKTTYIASVLLVDNMPHEFLVLQDILEDYNFHFRRANNSKQALFYAQQHKPDLILMGIDMPIMDGLNACKVFKSDAELSIIPVIFLTVHDTLPYKLQCFTLGCVDYVTKPFYPEEVVARIALHLGHKEIVSNLAKRLENTDKNTSNNNHSSKSAKIVQVACEKLLANMKKPPKLDELARQLSTNRDYLNTLFRETIGQPPFTWLREQRLCQACHMLKTMNKPLKYIADECGYSSPASFITSFKQRFGITPNEFRQQNDKV